MTKSGSLETQRKNQEWGQQRAHHLTEVAHQWNVVILQGLQDLAQAAWPNWYMLGLVSIRRYRLRHQVTPEAHIWRVEHDVPLDDQHLCAAYRVQLTLDDRDEPMLTVHSGTAIYPVTPLTVEALNTTLAQTGQDLPLLTPRKIDKAVSCLRVAAMLEEAAGISMQKALVRFTLILSGERPLDLADLENMAAVILGQAQVYTRGEWDTRLDSTCLACLHHLG